MGTQDSSSLNLNRQDFVSDQDVRWCPGCGDYAILAQVQRVLPELGIPREKFVFVSGIGCAARLPYYVNTYGFHTIHGRAPAIATGIKTYNPDLQVWVITGDGDALSIGGNHLIHALRRNIDIKILLFNNRIYGLTKGQYSPTSEFGKKTKSSPFGVIDYPINPITIALGAEATFVARSIDTDMKHLTETLRAASQHKGTAFVEILQNCVIFNDKGFGEVSDRKVRGEYTVYLEHGKPLLFGKDRNKGIQIRGGELKMVPVGGKEGVAEKDLLTHNQHAKRAGLAHLLASLEPPFPMPIGVFRSIERPSYEQLLSDQIEAAKAGPGTKDLTELIHGSETWTVGTQGQHS